MASHDDFPLLDLEADLAEATAILRDMDTTVQELLHESEGHYPPGAATFVQDVACVLLQLQTLLNPALRQAIKAERTSQAEEAGRWEPSGY
jgi:hypothetical protein